MDRVQRAPRFPHYRRRFRPNGGAMHCAMKFKQFVQEREDGISPEQAAVEYAKYLSEFLDKEITSYYTTYQQLPFFREKYHPYYLGEEYGFLKNVFANRSRKFLADFESGKYRSLLLEISFQRLYGRGAVESESNLAEAAYKYNDWACEIPLEYQHETPHSHRIPMRSPLEFVILADVPDKVFKLEVVNAIKPHLDDFMIYMAERTAIRTAFIGFEEGTDVKAISDRLNEGRITIQEFLLRFEPCNPIKERVRMRVCPPICSHPIIISRDVALTEQLIRKLDAEMGNGNGGASFADSVPADLNDKLRLDLQLLYLRLVHNYCYYGRVKGQNYIELFDQGGPGHVRVDLTNDLYEIENGMANNNANIKFYSVDPTKADRAMVSDNNGMEINYAWEDELRQSCQVADHQIEWLKEVERFAMNILNKDLTPPAFVEDRNEVETQWKQYCNLNTIVDGPDRFRCRICQKLFNETKFVWKHLGLKHGSNYELIRVQCGIEQMRQLFVNAHKETRCNPYERLVFVPVLQKPASDFDTITTEFHKRSGSLRSRNNSQQPTYKRQREYYDFDKPQMTKSIHDQV
ncbi:bifunctional Zinc finger C2H2-type/SERRATE-Ars2 [Babesia duncani]|uniref:Bifunctional Zinc finger C2H2-type/SERRATE-Ars2 n=1 Tax=Babesia duncani TaxID=323732 RepID=A0AAD9PLE6_9APIC|nr:bifunctional Zinc finger C2H2-type/SERRATE-Ars2 [Babesia duncani]